MDDVTLAHDGVLTATAPDHWPEYTFRPDVGDLPALAASTAQSDELINSVTTVDHGYERHYSRAPPFA